MSQSADFFVSYTSTDRAWAEWIAWQLEADGYTIVVQAWDFRPGSDFVQQMHQVVQEAKQTIAVLSPAYLNSAFGAAEWGAVFAKDPTGELGLLLPVRVEEVEPPGLLTTRIYVDLVGKNTLDARAALLAAARGARGKPAEEPKFPGRIGQPRGSRTEAPRFPGELPALWNVPYHPNPFFTGRDLLLAELHTMLTTSEAAIPCIVLTGLGGIGKTQLAAEYAYRHQANYDLVWWVRGEQPTSLLGDYVALAMQSPLAADLDLGQDVPQEAVVAAVRDWLEHHQRWLLILDNVDDPQAVAELLPRNEAGHLIVTSRTGVGWERLATPLSVEVLARADAADFLLTRTGEAGPEAEAAATALADILDGLPLALEQAGAYIAITGAVSLARYAELFTNRAPELLTRGEPLDYQHTVATTWSLAVHRLQQTEPAAVGLLTLAAFLGSDDLPLPLLTAYAKELPEPLAIAASDSLAFADSVVALRRLSLVRVIADGLFVHRLLQTVVRTALEAEAEMAWAASAIRLLRAGFPHESHEIATWRDCERLLPHALAVVDHGHRLEVEPVATLWLLAKTAAYLWSRAQFRQALTLQEQALADSRRLLGDDHPDTLTSMNNLAATRRALGDLQGARQLHEQALAGRKRVLGDDHPDTLGSMSNLALTLQDLGDLHGARQLNEQALAGRKRVLGENHPETLQSINNLAATLIHLGDLQEARDLFEQVLAARRRVLGDDHPSTLTSMNNLATTRRALGDLQGARDLYEQVLAGRKRVLGEHHPSTLQSINILRNL